MNDTTLNPPRFSPGDRVFVMGFQVDRPQQVGVALGWCREVAGDQCRVDFDDGAGEQWVLASNMLLAEHLAGLWIQVPDSEGEPGPPVVLEKVAGERLIILAANSQRESYPIVPFWLAANKVTLATPNEPAPFSPTAPSPEPSPEAPWPPFQADSSPVQDTYAPKQSTPGYAIVLAMLALVVLGVPLCLHPQFGAMGLAGLLTLLVVVLFLRRRKTWWALSSALAGAGLVFAAYWYVPPGRDLSPFQAGQEAQRLAQEFQPDRLLDWSRFDAHRRQCRRFAAQYPRHAELLQAAERDCAQAVLHRRGELLDQDGVTDTSAFLRFREHTERWRQDYPEFQPHWEKAESDFAQRGLDALVRNLQELPGPEHEKAQATREWRDLLARHFPALKKEADAVWQAWGGRSRADLVAYLNGTVDHDYLRVRAAAPWREFLTAQFPGESEAVEKARLAWQRRAEKAAVERLGRLAALPVEGFQTDAGLRHFLWNQAGVDQDALRRAADAWASRAAEAWLKNLAVLAPLDVTQFQRGEADRTWLRDNFRPLAPRLTEGETAWARASVQAWAKAAESVAAADLPAFEKAALPALYLGKRFPALDTELQKPRKAWGQRTLDEYQTRLLKTAPGDFAAFQKGRPQRDDFAAKFADFAAPLRARESAWGLTTAESAIANVMQLLADDPIEASLALRKTAEELRACGDHAQAQAVLLKARRGAVAAGLDQAKAQTKSLIKADRFQAAEKLALGLEARAAKEAQAVGLSQPLIQFRAGCEFLAELARRAGKADP